MRLYKEYLSDEIINYYYSLALNYKKLTYEDVVRLDLELEDIETLETNLKHKKLNQQIVYGMKVKTWLSESNDSKYWLRKIKEEILKLNEYLSENEEFVNLPKNKTLKEDLTNKYLIWYKFEDIIKKSENDKLFVENTLTRMWAYDNARLNCKSAYRKLKKMIEKKNLEKSKLSK